jgi:hypothetical protein
MRNIWTLPESIAPRLNSCRMGRRIMRGRLAPRRKIHRELLLHASLSAAGSFETRSDVAMSKQGNAPRISIDAIAAVIGAQPDEIAFAQSATRAGCYAMQVGHGAIERRLKSLATALPRELAALKASPSTISALSDVRSSASSRRARGPRQNA